MQIIKYVDLFVGALINLLLYAFVIKNIFKSNYNVNKFKIIISLIIGSLLLSAVNLVNKDTFKAFITIPFVIISMKVIFTLSYDKSIIYTLFATFYMFIAEIIGGTIISLVSIDYNFISNNILGTTIGALIVSFITIILLHIKELKILATNIAYSTYKNESSIITIFVIISIGIVLYRISSTMNSHVGILLNIIISSVFLVIIYMYYKETTKVQEISKNYNEMLNYLERYEKELVDKRKIIHDYKNQLIVINGYIGNNKKLKEYINELINEQKQVNENSIIENIDKLPSGIKGLIYYKFSHIINNNISVSLEISGNLKKFEKIDSKLNKDILKILGILIDNAIEATEVEIDKYINIKFSMKKDLFIIKIENPFTKNLKTNNFMNPGYSTKGNNRGYGLSLVKDILNNEKDILLNLYNNNNIFYSEIILTLK